MKNLQFKNNKILIIHILLAISFAIFLVNWAFPFLRFTNPKANYIFSINLMAFPGLMLINGFFFKKKNSKTLNTLILIFPTLWLLVAMMITFISLIGIKENNIDPSFERINEVKLEDSFIRVYRTNGGATTAFGIVVRQEKNILLGLKLVKDILNEYPKYDVEVKQTAINSVSLDDKPFLLKKHIYF